MATVKAKLFGKRNTLIRCFQITVPAVLMLILLHPALYAGSNGATTSVAAANTAAATASSQSGSQQADFLFDRPKGFIGFRIGRFLPRSTQDFVRDRLLK